MDIQSNICLAIKTLEKEQKIISGSEVEFQFLSMSQKLDTIPFLLYKRKKNKPFIAYYKNIASPYFRLEKFDEETCFAELLILKAIDMEGNPAVSYDDFYALQKTDASIIVNLNFFLIIESLPSEYVNRPLPIIEPKW